MEISYLEKMKRLEYKLYINKEKPPKYIEQEKE